jgi:ferritin-like protein
MAASSATLHEPPEKLGPERIDRHRATVSIMEELEAIDWYDQRAAGADNDELREILEHNRDDEKEHAAMALEWLRRRDPAFDEQLRRYLFTERSITSKSPDEPGDDADAGDGGGSDSLGIGSLRSEVTP